MTSGHSGEAVRDLQRRLGAAGYLPAPAPEAGRYCARTTSAVETFQADRGLRVTGDCDETTWNALVEASWQLGDRLLVLRSPNLRGDDVHELQSRLARLGFDCGRVDGIFGPDTSRALLELQTNSGLRPDGVCGAETIATIVRLCRQTGEGPGVAAVREIERLRDTDRSLTGSRIVVGQFGGLSTLARQVVAGLRRVGAHVVVADEPDASAQAATANRFGAAVYLGLEARAEPTASIAFYGVPGFESAGGRHLAELIGHGLRSWPVGTTAVWQGMRLPVLRETSMPAVVCALGPVRSVVDHAPEIADVLIAALTAWTHDPIQSL